MPPSPLETWTLAPCCYSSARIAARYATIEVGTGCVSVSARTLRTEMASRNITAPRWWMNMAPAAAEDMSSPRFLGGCPPRGGS
eukprot:scaffold21085_cov67-Skeletonema_dohrnii-CCMP3373.AAC.1